MAVNICKELRDKNSNKNVNSSKHSSSSTDQDLQDNGLDLGTLSSCSDRPLAYRTPLLSLLPPLATDNGNCGDDDVDKICTWSDAYKCARSLILESQKERFQSKERRIRASLKGSKTIGEISLKIGQFQNASKKVLNNYEKTATHCRDDGMSYELQGFCPAGLWDYGIPSGQWIYPSRPPKTPKRINQRDYLPRRKTPEKIVKKHVEMLKPWIVNDSPEKLEFYEIPLNKDGALKCNSHEREKEMHPVCKTVYVPHHR